MGETMHIRAILIRPDQRVKAQELNLPLWHGLAPPKTLDCEAVYAHRLDSIFATDASVQQKYRRLFNDKVEYWKGVVYMPQQRQKSTGAGAWQQRQSEWTVVSSKRSKKTFPT